MTEPEPTAPEPTAPEPTAPEPTLPEPTPAPDRAKLGGALFVIGALTLPLGLGAGLGYWASDRGVLWMPTMLTALTGVWLLALVVMLGGSYLLGPGSGRPTHRKRIIALGITIPLLALVWIGIRAADQDAPLTSLSVGEFYRAFEEDARQYRDLDQSLDGLIKSLERQESLARRSDKPPVLSADEEAAVLDAWQAYVQCAFALDRIRSFHEDYFRFDASRVQRDRHLRSFLLTFAAELAVYHHTACLIEVVDRNPNCAKFLNVARPKRAIPKDSLAYVREELTGMTDVSRVVAGRAYLRWLDVTLGAQAEARANGYGWLWDEVERRLGQLEQRHPDKLRGAVAADFAPIQRRLKSWSMPIQKGVAEMMGDTKVRRPGAYLITQAQLDALREKELAPGDVMLGRKNWYLSNVGLPGFWPHAMLYVGTNAQLASDFDAVPEVVAWVTQSSGGQAKTFTDYLRLRYPKAWASRVGAAQPLTVIEAVGEGVLQHSLRQASGDYLAALRPRLPPLAKAHAIERAFGYLGRPYDYDFDFATDDKLVCSELVWRSYRPRGGVPGLRFKTVTTVGRETVPPQEIARCFLAEQGQEQRQLDFVCFLEGRERDQRAIRAGLDAFLKTPTRSKWDVTQR